MSAIVFTPRDVIKFQMIQITLECIVYGFYALLFGIAAFAMHCSQKHSQHVQYNFWAMVTLFVIGTAVLLCDIIGSAGSLYNTFGLGGITPSMDFTEARTVNHCMIVTTQMGYTFANIVADFILIHRCYVIWNRNKTVIFVPALVSVMNNTLGVANIPILFLLQLGNFSTETLLNLANNAQNMLVAFMAINVFTNVLLTFLIGGRIWWIMHQVDKISSRYSTSASVGKKQYLKTIALVLESGLLYPVIVIIFEIVTNTVPDSPSLYPLMTLIAGIAPTLIIARVQFGVSINSVEETLQISSGESKTRIAVGHDTIPEFEPEPKV
ncbi:hypothetical protein VKT23_000009 [Stygiomarasmius scandens]|uniref:Uncharacterized protein n=2 Tax=Marasmiellus scandens TaxID=2682957 RepID=A0ABR1K3B0_9AGAR